MKVKFFNDTGRVVSIHPATFSHGCTADSNPIQPLEERTFFLPQNTYPSLKIWDYGPEIGLKILVSPIVEDSSDL